MSGVLDTQAEDVANYYRDQFEIEPIKELQEWCRISGKKHTS
ncbi:ribosomal protein L11 methyltransferase [Vibrio ishigakensis]|nr:ribosomal protein L11 methyltransferase [Vibrio ishigakensis]GAM69669.1 ribosomal protein L11 methyltransferase [Vibrio sp. JCM 19236]